MNSEFYPDLKMADQESFLHRPIVIFDAITRLWQSEEWGDHYYEVFVWAVLNSDGSRGEKQLGQIGGGEVLKKIERLFDMGYLPCSEGVQASFFIGIKNVSGHEIFCRFLRVPGSIELVAEDDKGPQ